MHPNSRFALAIYAVALARVAHETAEGQKITSEQLAETANTHPVVVRRLLGPLRDAGLLTSQPGPGGGWQLSRPAGEITLRDIYLAMVQEPIFSVPEKPPGIHCPLGEGFPALLTACFREAEEAMESKLGQVTVADIVESVPLMDEYCRAPGGTPGEMDIRNRFEAKIAATRTVKSWFAGDHIGFEG